MVVMGSIACGHDASYPFKTTGVTQGSVITGQCGARVASRPLLRSVRTSGNYRRGYTRTRLEARWAIRLDR